MKRRGFLKEDRGDFLVGARTKPDKKRDYPGYDGPVARVSHDKDWLRIVTDDYEGSAMLNIEALPYLRRALAKIAKQIRSAAQTQGEGK